MKIIESNHSTTTPLLLWKAYENSASRMDAFNIFEMKRGQMIPCKACNCHIIVTGSKCMSLKTWTVQWKLSCLHSKLLSILLFWTHTLHSSVQSLTNWVDMRDNSAEIFLKTFTRKAPLSRYDMGKAFPLPTMVLPILNGALRNGFGEAVATCNMPKPCKYLTWQLPEEVSVEPHGSWFCSTPSHWPCAPSRRCREVSAGTWSWEPTLQISMLINCLLKFACKTTFLLIFTNTITGSTVVLALKQNITYSDFQRFKFSTDAWFW